MLRAVAGSLLDRGKQRRASREIDKRLCISFDQVLIADKSVPYRFFSTSWLIIEMFHRAVEDISSGTDSDYSKCVSLLVA